MLIMPELLKDFIVATAVVTSLAGIPTGGLLWCVIRYGHNHPEIMQRHSSKAETDIEPVLRLPFLAPEPFGH